jgi:hypothetical protein
VDWFRKRKQARAKKEALEIGLRAVEKVNAAMSKWEATSLQLRRTMLADSFDERITDQSQGSGLEFFEWAEIEAIACLKNWIELRESVVSEIASFIDLDAWETLKIIGAEDEYLRKLYERFDEVGHALAEDIENAIEQEGMRRGVARDEGG